MSTKENTGDSSAASVALTAYEVQAGDVLQSSCSSYSVLNFIGEGSFGKIAASINLRTKQNVAVKILKKKESTQDIEREVSMLKLIGHLDSTYMVRFHEQFVHMEQNCLVFERLDMSLYDLLKWRQWKYLHLHQIRPISKQVLVALDALKAMGVLHADIKPDNIMFVHLQDQPLRVKLIDFGCAMMKSQIEQGMYIQPNGYRAPEISLGLPFTEAVDVWGVGCVLAFLYMAQNPFCISSDYQMMKDLVTVLGQPEDRLLRDGEYSRRFFIEEQGADSSSWRLMTAEEFTATNNLETEGLPSSLRSLISLIFFHPKLEAAEMDDRMVFVSLLKGLLHVDGDQRMTPSQALQHPFINMSHLRKDGNSWDYLTSSQLAMKVCPNVNSVYCATSDSSHCAISEKGYTDTMDKVSCEALVSTSVPKSSTGDKYTSSEVLDFDLSISTDTSVSSIKDDDTSELSWCSDAAVDNAAVDVAVDDAAVDDVAVDNAAVDVAVDDAAVDVAVDDAAVDVAVDDVSFTGDKYTSSEVLDSDLSISTDTSVSSIKDDDTSELSWCSDAAVDDAAVDVAVDNAAVDDVAVDNAAVDVAVDDVSSTGDKYTSSEVLDSDLSISTDTSVSSIKDDDTSELSWCSDAAVDDAAVDVAVDDVAVDVTAAATASSGGKRKWLRRIRKFFSSLISCFRPKVED
ncbi:homeodomain-interacting protein kinase 3-like [Paralichthys olivaceus]|uniref:homeodomain-interacting protein kinase 3-like n=1 Tax=Paralichthys olivaceus TaxID=8255 RepID=UPI0037516892